MAIENEHKLEIENTHGSCISRIAGNARLKHLKKEQDSYKNQLKIIV